MEPKSNIVVVGGGTGTYTVLSGLRKYPLNLSAIISMTDSGGSNRVIRDEFGLLPTSDLRQCMVALASDLTDEKLRSLFTYRFNQGTGISGMTFGNLFMAALTDIYGSQEKAIEATCEVLDVKGEVLPVTYDNVHLVARYDNGKQVLGEHFIDEPDDEIGKHKIVDFEVIPKAKANKKALLAIKNANLVLLGPGDLYTSIVCNLVIDGIARAIKNTKAKKVYIMNLMTKFGETNNFKASDHLDVLNKYLDVGVIDFVLVNNTDNFPRGVLARYKQEKAYPVVDDLKNHNNIKIVRRNLIARKIFTKPKSDKIKRSLIRHDSKRLAKAIVSLL